MVKSSESKPRRNYYPLRMIMEHTLSETVRAGAMTTLFQVSLCIVYPAKNDLNKKLNVYHILKGLFKIIYIDCASCWLLTVRDGDTVKHYRIRQLDEGGFFIARRVTFRTLSELVDHYNLEADGLCVNLRKPCTQVRLCQYLSTILPNFTKVCQGWNDKYTLIFSLLYLLIMKWLWPIELPMIVSF